MLGDRDNGHVNVYFTADIITPTGTLEGGFCMTAAIPTPGALALFGLAGVFESTKGREAD